MFADQSMLAFNSLEDFQKFYKSLNLPIPWRITTEEMNQRGDRIKHTPYVNHLRRKFGEKKLFRRNVSVAETVSFIDNYFIMMKVIDSLKRHLPAEIFDRISLYNEYKIAFSKNRRIDFILEYEKTILLVEFRLSSKFPNVSSVWHRKESELLIYKELLKNYLPSDYNVILYAFIAMPEYNYGNKIFKQIKYNNENADYFARYIKRFLTKMK